MKYIDKNTVQSAIYDLFTMVHILTTSKDVNRRLNIIKMEFDAGKYDKRQARDTVGKEKMKLKNELFNGEFAKNRCGGLG